MKYDVIVSDEAYEHFSMQTIEILDEDAFEFVGYAATWDIDLDGDQFRKGNFREPIQVKKQAKLHLPVHYAHVKEDILGVILIDDIKEDSRGLLVHGIIDVSTTLGKVVAIAIQDRYLRGLSVGGIALRVRETNGVDTFDSFDLLEVSIGTEPRNPDAGIIAYTAIEEE